MEDKYWFTDVEQKVSQGLIKVECYTLQDDEQVATIELKYEYDEYTDEWKVESAEFHTNPTIKEIELLQDELLERARDLFHEFCYACYTYSDFDDESNWFV